MPLKKIQITFLYIFLFFSITACNNSIPVETGNTPTLQQGRRDYTWTADTSAPMPYNIVTKMWGDSEDNVWAVGPGGDADKVIWHFDGKKWSLFPIVLGLDPFCIFGIGKDTWIGGFPGQLWKYDGYTWNKMCEIKTEDNRNIWFQNIWGDRPDDLYAVGSAFPEESSKCIAVLVHYDGKTWTRVNIPVVNGSFLDIRKDKTSNLYFIGHFKTWGGTEYDSNKVFTFDGQNLKEIYAGLDEGEESCRIYSLDGSVCIEIGSKVYTYIDNKLKMKMDLSNSNFSAAIMGRTEKDFFYCSKDNGIGHYNGSDYTTIYPHFRILGGYIILENSVFFHTYDYNTGRHIFLRGKLKENNQGR